MHPTLSLEDRRDLLEQRLRVNADERLSMERTLVVVLEAINTANNTTSDTTGE